MPPVRLQHRTPVSMEQQSTVIDLIKDKAAVTIVCLAGQNVQGSRQSDLACDLFDMHFRNPQTCKRRGVRSSQKH